ncbi:MAG: HAD family phosphatase [Anaerolineales bacterium]
MKTPTTNTHPPAIIFDFGGVLLDWNPRYLYRKLFPNDEQGMERFLAEIGFNEWNHLQDAGRPFSEAITELCARHPQYCDLIRAYDERFLESIKGAIPGTVDILRYLWTAGFSLFGFSNWPAEKFYLARPRYAFFDWFQGIVISGEVGIAKPDPRIFQLLLVQVDRPAGECLLIDDSPANIATAQGLGFQTIHFHKPAQLAGELTRRGLLPEPQL